MRVRMAGATRTARDILPAGATQEVVKDGRGWPVPIVPVRRLLAMLFVLHRFTYRRCSSMPSSSSVSASRRPGVRRRSAAASIGSRSGSVCSVPADTARTDVVRVRAPDIKPGDRLLRSPLTSERTAFNAQDVVAHLRRCSSCTAAGVSLHKSAVDELHSDHERLTAAGLTTSPRLRSAGAAAGCRTYVVILTIVCSFPVRSPRRDRPRDRRGALGTDRS